MASVSFNIRSKVKNSEAVVYIKLSNGRQNCFEAKTNILVNTNNWNKDYLIKSNHLAEEVEKVYTDLNDLQNFLKPKLNVNSKEVYSKLWLENQIKVWKKEIILTDKAIVTEYIKYYKKKSEREKSVNTLQTYETLNNIIIQFQKYKGIANYYFADLNAEFVTDFLRWSKEIEIYNDNNIKKILSTLKSIAIDAEVNELPIHQYIKIAKYKIVKPPKKIVITLNNDEVFRIKNLKFLSDKLENVQSWFCIGLESAQRGGDFIEFKKEQFIENDKGFSYNLQQGKTDVDLSVAITDPQTIGIIKNKFPYKISLVKYNKYIKELCKLAGITEIIEGDKSVSIMVNNASRRRFVRGFYPKYELISAHTLRRTFCTFAYHNGFNITKIMNRTGHKKISTLMDYIGVHDLQEEEALNFGSEMTELRKALLEREPKLTIIKPAVNQ